MTSDYHWNDFDRASATALIQRFQAEGTWLSPRVPAGKLNSLADVAGVRVGHVTLDEGEIQTGCTAIDFAAVPVSHPLNCGCAVLNGFAKPIGLIQLQELGLISGPILLGNTYSVSALFDASVRWASAVEPRLGRELSTFNPLVLECNDAYLNDLQAQALTREHGLQAIASVTEDFQRGAVGAGRGMSCFGMKGGIGSASRMAHTPQGNYCVGALVLSNFGHTQDFTLNGVRLGGWIAHQLEIAPPSEPEKGSIIIVLATDAPLDSRRLSRLARRAGVGIGRMGAFWGNGSGDIGIAVSTATEGDYIDDDDIDDLFRAAADATEAAIVDALLQAVPVTGFRQHHRHALSDFLDTLCHELAPSHS